MILINTLINQTDKIIILIYLAIAETNCVLHINNQ